MTKIYKFMYNNKKLDNRNRKNRGLSIMNLYVLILMLISTSIYAQDVQEVDAGTKKKHHGDHGTKNERAYRKN